MVFEAQVCENDKNENDVNLNLKSNGKEFIEDIVTDSSI